MLSGWRPSRGPVLRGPVLMLLAACVTLLALSACTTSPTGAGSCNCKPPNTACCVNHNKCCDPQYPHHCNETGKCYMYFTDAQQACGNNYEICGGAARATSFAAPTTDASSLELPAVPDRACQDQ